MLTSCFRWTSDLRSGRLNDDAIGGLTARAVRPLPQQRNTPDPVSVTLLGRFAVNNDHRGKGCAGSLLLFALRTALAASRRIGSFGVVTPPLDGSARSFHPRWGFDDLPFDPRESMIVRMIDLERSGLDC